MTETLHTWIHRDADDSLVGATWVRMADEDAWNLVLRVLEGFMHHQKVFESLAGQISVVVSKEGEQTSEVWDVTIDRDGLQQLRERGLKAQKEGLSSTPMSVMLNASVDVFLPEDVISVDVATFAIDDSRAGAWPLPVVPITTDTESPAGFRRWKTAPRVGEQESPVWLQLYYSDVVDPPELGLFIKSSIEIWRFRTFDGEGEVAGGRQNLQLLADTVATVSSKTGGVSEGVQV